jgi:hypothetical protein
MAVVEPLTVAVVAEHLTQQAVVELRGRIMPATYLIYTVGRGGHFLGAPEVVECADDKEAIEKAIQVVKGFDAQIWDHRRFVARLPPGSRPMI